MRFSHDQFSNETRCVWLVASWLPSDPAAAIPSSSSTSLERLARMPVRNRM